MLPRMWDAMVRLLSDSFFFFNTYGTWYSGTWYSEVELSDSDSTVGLRGGINNPSEKLCL